MMRYGSAEAAEKLKSASVVTYLTTLKSISVESKMTTVPKLDMIKLQ